MAGHPVMHGKQPMTLVLVSTSFITANLVYLGLAYFFLTGPDGQAAAQPPDFPLHFILGAVAVVDIIVGLVIGFQFPLPSGWEAAESGMQAPSLAPGDSPSAEAFLGRAWQRVIVASAFLEASGLLGLVTIILGSPPIWGYAMIVASILALLAFQPRVLRCVRVFKALRRLETGGAPDDSASKC